MASFAEDRAIIEALQLIWHLTPKEKPMAFIPHDKAPAIFRRAISGLIKAESEDDHAEIIAPHR